MQIRKAPEKLSNTKLSTSADIIEKLSGDGWTIKLRPHSIYKILATHDIFVKFAHSNQALCKQLRPFFGQKLPSEKDLKSKLDFLQDKISYETPTDNNLLEYLANALIYKAFLLDANEQIPQDKKIGEYEQKCREEVGPENFEKLKEQYKKVEERKQALDNKKETLRKEEYDLAKKEPTWRIRWDKLINTAKTPISEDYETDLEKLISDYKIYHEAKKNKMANDTEETRIALDENTKTYSTSKSTFLHHLEGNGNLDLDSAITSCRTYLNLKDKCKKHPTELEAPTEEHEKAVSDYEAITGHESFTKYKHLQEDFGREYRKLDYKISVHIRFARSMNGLNAYTEDNFDTTSFRQHDTPYQETGAHDEYGWKKVKYDNLMKLARGAINRYVTVQNGGVYTTVIDHNRERSKFAFGPSGITDDDKKTMLWNFKNHKDDDYALKDRIKNSCKNFNDQIDKYVISTYANYYCADNVLEIDGSGRLIYLEYVYDEDKNVKQLEIPLIIDQEKGEQKAKLHVFFEQKDVYNLDPERSGGFRYKHTPIGTTKRTAQNQGPLDIAGLLYTIRKNKIAVCPPKNRFHSSMWAGKKVQAAGLLAAWNGKLVVVDNMSGHYQPNWYMLYMAWEQFFNQGVFNDSAILGISTSIDVVEAHDENEDIGINAIEGVDRCSQFFDVKKFMQLAKNDFKIGETVKDLQIPIKEKVSIDSNESQDQTENYKCSDVLKTCYVREYDAIWNNKEYSELLACNFIAEMEYDWSQIVPNARTHYDQIFRGKKKFMFKLVPANRIENVFKKRTKLVKKKLRKVKGMSGVPEMTEEAEEKKESLIVATNSYKEVFSEIGVKSDLADKEKYKLITCIANIYYANDEYSEFLKRTRLDEYEDIRACQEEMANWVELTGTLLDFTASKKAGLDGNKIHHLAGLRSSSNEGNSTRVRQSDDLENGVDVTSETESTAKAKRLLLVDEVVYAQTPSKKTPPSPRRSQETSQTSAQPTAQRQPPKKKSRSAGGQEFHCIECKQDVVINSWDKSRCPKCGKMGCLDPI